jgi:hypothetical protein
LFVSALSSSDGPRQPYRTYPLDIYSGGGRFLLVLPHRSPTFQVDATLAILLCKSSLENICNDRPRIQASHLYLISYERASMQCHTSVRIFLMLGAHGRHGQRNGAAGVHLIKYSKYMHVCMYASSIYATSAHIYCQNCSRICMSNHMFLP